MVLEKTLESLLDSKEIKTVKQSILKEINTKHSLEELMLKLQYDAKSQITGKDPDAGKMKAGGEGDDRR